MLCPRLRVYIQEGRQISHQISPRTQGDTRKTLNHRRQDVLQPQPPKPLDIPTSRRRYICLPSPSRTLSLSLSLSLSCYLRILSVLLSPLSLSLPAPCSTLQFFTGCRCCFREAHLLFLALSSPVTPGRLSQRLQYPLIKEYSWNHLRDPTTF